MHLRLYAESWVPSAATVCLVGGDVARALAYVHGEGYSHRRLSASSVLLTSRCRAKLLGPQCGADEAALRCCLSPETAADDVLALGLLLCELMLQRPPPSAPAERAAFVAEAEAAAPPALGALIRLTTDGDHMARLQAHTVAEELLCIAAELVDQPPPPGAPSPAPADESDEVHRLQSQLAALQSELEAVKAGVHLSASPLRPRAGSGLRKRQESGPEALCATPLSCCRSAPLRLM